MLQFVSVGNCTVGFSGVLFALITIYTSISGQSRYSLCFLQIPSRIYPWVLLLAMSLFFPNVSFIGHLSGIICGYLYISGAYYCLLPSAAFHKFESHSFFAPIVSTGYITAPDQNSIFSAWNTATESENSTTVHTSSTFTPFSGEGHKLGTGTAENV